MEVNAIIMACVQEMGQCSAYLTHGPTLTPKVTTSYLIAYKMCFSFVNYNVLLIFFSIVYIYMNHSNIATIIYWERKFSRTNKKLIRKNYHQKENYIYLEKKIEKNRVHHS